MNMMWRKTGTNQRRGEWNALLLVMFALLAVAPASMLAAAPLSGAAHAQPQAVWQWLQSPQGAPARDLLVRAFDLDNFPNLPPDEWATLVSTLEQAPHLTASAQIDAPQIATRDVSQLLNHDGLNHFLADIASPPSLLIDRSRIALRPLSPHEAAFRSGVRTNARLE
jgi:hypothetical protein